MAAVYDISREKQDRFALSSHQKAVAAMDEKRFARDRPRDGRRIRKGEYGRRGRRGPEARHVTGEAGQAQTSLQGEGSVTPGNSSSLNDGAAAVLLVSKEYAKGTASNLWPRYGA